MTTIWTGQACYVAQTDGRYVVLPVGDTLPIAEYGDRDYEIVDSTASEYRTMLVTGADMAITRARKEDAKLRLVAEHGHRVALVGPQSRGFDGDILPADLPQDS